MSSCIFLGCWRIQQWGLDYRMDRMVRRLKGVERFGCAALGYKRQGKAKKGNFNFEAVV